MTKKSINNEMALEIILALKGKKFERLVATLDRNNYLTSCWDLSSGEMVVYKEGFYLTLEGTRCKFSVFAWDRDGEMEIADRKPVEGKLHRLYSESLLFHHCEICNLVDAMLHNYSAQKTDIKPEYKVVIDGKNDFYTNDPESAEKVAHNNSGSIMYANTKNSESGKYEYTAVITKTKAVIDTSKFAFTWVTNEKRALSIVESLKRSNRFLNLIKYNSKGKIKYYIFFRNLKMA